MRRFALKIFSAVGDAVALKDEKLLDAVTALSGSGPAYVYLFVKAMADAAMSEGIPRDARDSHGAEDDSRRRTTDARVEARAPPI